MKQALVPKPGSLPVSEQLPREPVRFVATSPPKSAVVHRAVTAVQCNRTGSNLEGGVDSHTLQTIFRRNEKETKWKEKVG